MGVRGIKAWGMTGARSDAYSAELVGELYQGKRVARTWRSGEGSDGFGGMFQTFKPDAYVGKRVRFSAALRTVDVTGRAALCFRVDGPNGRRAIAFDNMGARPPISGTTPWATHSCVLDVPPEATMIFISCFIEGRGELFWADLAFEVVDASVPVTNMQRVHDGPENLDFSQS